MGFIPILRALLRALLRLLRLLLAMAGWCLLLLAQFPQRRSRRRRRRNSGYGADRLTSAQAEQGKPLRWAFWSGSEHFDSEYGE